MTNYLSYLSCFSPPRLNSPISSSSSCTPTIQNIALSSLQQTSSAMQSPKQNLQECEIKIANSVEKENDYDNNNPEFCNKGAAEIQTSLLECRNPNFDILKTFHKKDFILTTLFSKTNPNAKKLMFLFGRYADRQEVQSFFTELLLPFLKSNPCQDNYILLGCFIKSTWETTNLYNPLQSEQKNIPSFIPANQQHEHKIANALKIINLCINCFKSKEWDEYLSNAVYFTKFFQDAHWLNIKDNNINSLEDQLDFLARVIGMSNSSEVLQDTLFHLNKHAHACLEKLLKLLKMILFDEVCSFDKKLFHDKLRYYRNVDRVKLTNEINTIIPPNLLYEPLFIQFAQDHPDLIIPFLEIYPSDKLISPSPIEYSLEMHKLNAFWEASAFDLWKMLLGDFSSALNDLYQNLDNQSKKHLINLMLSQVNPYGLLGALTSVCSIQDLLIIYNSLNQTQKRELLLWHLLGITQVNIRCNFEDDIAVIQNVSDPLEFTEYTPKFRRAQLFLTRAIRINDPDLSLDIANSLSRSLTFPFTLKFFEQAGIYSKLAMPDCFFEPFFNHVLNDSQFQEVLNSIILQTKNPRKIGFNYGTGLLEQVLFYTKGSDKKLIRTIKNNGFIEKNLLSIFNYLIDRTLCNTSVRSKDSLTKETRLEVIRYRLLEMEESIREKFDLIQTHFVNQLPDDIRKAYQMDLDKRINLLNSKLRLIEMKNEIFEEDEKKEKELEEL